jgi:cell division septal protein FtsQ
VKVALKNFRKVVVISIISVLLLGLYSATRSELLDVDEIEVLITGGNKISSNELIALSGISISQSMISVDSDEAESLILMNPWVDEVEINKEWPNSISIWVSLREVFAYVGTLEGKFASIDADGVVLELSKLNSSDDFVTLLVESVADPGSKIEGIEMMLRATQAISPDLQQWIKIISPTASGVRAEMQGSVFVNLGVSEDFTTAMSDLKAVLGQVELMCIQSIDVSVRENPIIERDNTKC